MAVNSENDRASKARNISKTNVAGGDQAGQATIEKFENKGIFTK